MPATKNILRAVIAIVVLLNVVGFTPQALAFNKTIRVVCYNIEDDINGATVPLPGLIYPSTGSTNVLSGGVLEGIGEEIVDGDPAQPLDILALEETTSNPITVAPIVNALNAFYNVSNMYAMSTYQAYEESGDLADGNGPNAMVYNTRTLQLVASVPVDPPGGSNSLGSSTGEYREVMRYEFAPAGLTPAASNEFYIYVSHYKSGASNFDLTDRAEEAVIIRNDEAAHLPANARVVYVGDYNITASSEASYQTILATNSPGGAAQGGGFDPLNPTDNTNIDWGTTTTNTTILAMLTESATDLQYRDDLQCMTSNVYNGVSGALAYVPGTLHTFGNNGSIGYGKKVTSSTNTALNASLMTNPPISASQLRQDLSTASDHYPVVADYTVFLPDPLAAFSASVTNGVSPLKVVFTNTSTNTTNYSWMFGDGNISTLPNPTNTYAGAGRYTVTLTAVGVGGTNVLTLTNYIVVTNPLVQLAGPQFSSNGFQFAVTNANGSLITTAQESHIEIFAATNLTTPFSNWLLLSNSTVLTNGRVNVTDTNAAAQRFYRVLETP